MGIRERDSMRGYKKRESVVVGSRRGKEEEECEDKKE